MTAQDGQCAENKNCIVLRPKFDVCKLCPPPQRSGNFIDLEVGRLYDLEVEDDSKIKFYPDTTETLHILTLRKL